MTPGFLVHFHSLPKIPKLLTPYTVRTVEVGNGQLDEWSLAKEEQKISGLYNYS